jgi:hypothetical protein
MRDSSLRRAEATLVELAVAADDAEIVISVGDNGIGIEPEKLSAIFSMFSQVNHVHHRRGGLGIGLALSKSLIELHNLAIEIGTSIPSNGLKQRVLRCPTSSLGSPTKTLPSSASTEPLCMFPALVSLPAMARLWRERKGHRSQLSAAPT